MCCGIERERTVSCPLDCEYLQEAHLREKELELSPSDFPNPDIDVDEAFLERNESLLVLIASGLAASALRTGNVIDSDLKEALDSLVSTYRTLQSGLVYEAHPVNSIAAQIQSDVQDRIREIDEHLRNNDTVLRDSDVLGVLVFLQRLEIQWNNRRPKSLAFIDFLCNVFLQRSLAEAETKPLIL